MVAVRYDANRFYSVPEPDQKKPSSSYIIPYLSQDNGEYSVLVGQKKVICYEGQKSIEEKQSHLSNLLNKNMGKRMTHCIDKGFGGLIFYAGGRPTCFGGHVDKGESVEHAGARELLEETGIMNFLKSKSEKEEMIAEITKNLLEIHRSCNFSGIYFALDVAACPMLMTYITADKIAAENERIQRDELICKQSPTHRDKNVLSKKVSEMHAILWLPLKDLVKYLNLNPFSGELNTYIQSEIERAINLILGYVFNVTSTPKKNDTLYPEYQELYKKLRNEMTRKIPAQVTLDNERAANELVAALSPKEQKDVAGSKVTLILTHSNAEQNKVAIEEPESKSPPVSGL